MLLKKLKLTKQYLFWLIVAVIYYLLVRENMFVCDDFRYAFVQGTNVPVNSLEDAVRSQIHAYVYENGRFLVHTIVQYFAGVLGIECLRVANVFFFVGVCYFFNKLLSLRNKKEGIITVEILVLLLAIPVFGCTYLGNIAMSVNYLWTSALTLLFIYVVETLKHRKSPRTMLLILFLSLIVGAWQESFSIGMSVALFVYLVTNKKDVSGKTLAVVAAYWVGACLVILAPSNFIREASWNHDNTNQIIRLVQGIGSVVVYARFFDVMMLLMIYLLFTDIHKFRALVKKDVIFITASVVNALFVACVAFTGPHQLVSVELFSTIVILHWLYNNFSLCSCHVRNAIVIVSMGILTALIIPIYIYRVEVNRAYYAMIYRATAATDGCLIGGEYDRISYSPRNWFVRNYTTTERNQNCPMNTLSMWLTNGTNNELLKTRIPLSKKELVGICSNINKMSENVYHRKKDWFYVIRDTKPIENVKVEYRENWLASLRSYIFGKATTTHVKKLAASECSLFSYENNYYCIVYDSEYYPIVSVQ